MHKKTITIFFTVIFSIVLWGFITLSDVYFYQVSAKIKIIDLPKGFEPSAISAKTVNLSLRATGFELLPISIKSAPEFLVSANFDRDIQKISLKNHIENNSWLSGNINIVEFSPANINLEFDKINTRTVKISPEIYIEYRPGYSMVSELKINPDSIEISGPKSIINRIKEVKTVFKEFMNVDDLVSEVLELQKIDGVKLGTDKVNVEFEAQQIVDKVFKDVQVEIQNLPPDRNIHLFPGRMNIILRGGIRYLTQLDENNLKVYITYEQAINDTLGSLKPIIEIPEHTILINTQPEKLEYIIKK